MRVLVTGATGFVGSQLARALAGRGDVVRVLRRANSRLTAIEDLPLEHYTGDILEAEAVERAVAGCDVVFHAAALASYWRVKDSLVYRVNLEGTRNVLDACLKAAVPRLVYTSSVAAIGFPSGNRPATEDSPFTRDQERFAYAHSKYLAESEVRKAVASGLSAVIVNPAVVIGPGDHNMISGSIIVELARRSVPALPPGGVCIADVDAVVAGHLAAAERGRDGERYILGGENLSYVQMAGIIGEIVGRKTTRRTAPAWVLPPLGAAIDAFNRVNPRPPLVSGEQVRLAARNAFYASDKAVHELNYPLLPFRSAAEKAYRWYLDNGYLNS